MTNDPRIAARLHVADGLSGATLTLDAARAHYLRNVLRLAPGARIAVFNARDGEFAATITALTKNAASVALGERRRPPQAEPDLWLCFAPIKRARLDTMVEKATELGVARLIPVFTRHTVMERVNGERLAAIATEAAEQSERLAVPIVEPATDLARLLDDWPADRALIVADESGGGLPIAAALAALSGPLAVLTGPEGGFARDEFERLARHPSVRRVGLGPRILKADTAAIAALAVVQAVAGDGAQAPRFIAEDATSPASG
ncbi:MAG: 16S rRNA (uracil(1498)-N(3))-methyltransferase [Alphaproteobacteria bacterium]|nr:16S rRNA (uracil(1498)-N(3))-methyltransferase [Alphaproteobacteria bacterium]